MIRIEAICVGSELLLDRVNTDVNLISRQLQTVGVSLARNVLVPDDRDEIAGVLRDCLARCDVVFVTGGLGPTFDDVTREAVAGLLGRSLTFSEDVWRGIEDLFRRRGRTVTENNRQQAMVIGGAEVIDNQMGTAPGLVVTEQEKVIFLLPGPPNELEPMLEGFCTDYLKRRFGLGGAAVTFRFGFAGLGESVLEERCRDIIERYRGKGKVEFTILAKPMFIELLLMLAPGVDASLGTEVERLLRERAGDAFLGVDPPPLPELVAARLRERGLTIGLAESCTGGLVGKLLTDIPGSSVYFKGGVVAYSNEVKRRLLRVPRPALKKWGSVSEQVARLMARGARKYLKADVSIAVTGVAGPSGGTAEKPVGLVWLAVGLPGNRLHSERVMLFGNRARVRENAALAALDLLRRKLAAAPEVQSEKCKV